MGVQLLEIGIRMRKGVIFTIRGCIKSVCNHPFVMCMLCVLIYMYKTSPFMFSLLVTASPVLVCTAVLLGTLLFFGQPNIPEIEIDEKITHEALPIKTHVSRDAIVVEKNESYCGERYSDERRDEMGQPTMGPSLSESKLDEICKEGSVNVTAPLNKEASWEAESDNGEILEANRKLDVKIEKKKTEWSDDRLSDGEVIENHYASIPKTNDQESEYEKSEADSFDSERVNVDSLESPPRSAWKQEHPEEGEEEEDDSLDSGSDRAESSSPDASMADITPMLDELHPLLDEEAAQPVQMSHVGSDAASERSSRSSTSSIESGDDIENDDGSEVADDDNEDGEDDYDDDDDDAQGDKEDQSKSAITWTEEDQKNLMDLGSSEIERNQRLEKLILRRRTRKNISMVPEINLIDLESSDFPFHIAPISTRQNPFDLPNESNDNSGLPPIPGSAPSILLPRRNPFDIPYDSSEGNPNEMGDEFQEELNSLQSREPYFRRRESFSVGPSVFAPNRQQRQGVKLRPFFVPERMVIDESSYSTFQRQSSEISDSKASSVPETESVSSVEDVDEQKLEGEDNPQQLEAISRMEEVIELCPSGGQYQVPKRESSEEDASYEPLVISEIKHVSEHVGHGSQSSEEEESLELGSVDTKDIEIDVLKFQSQDGEDHHEEGSVVQPVEVQATAYNSSSEAVEQRCSRGSSASSLSEVSEMAFTEIDGEGLSVLDEGSHSVVLEPDISRQTSDLSMTSILVNEVLHKEPVYDSSPPAIRNNFSPSSSSSNVNAQSDPGFPPVLVEWTVSESQEIEKEIPTTIKMLPEPPKLHLADEDEPTRVNSNIRAHKNLNFDFSGADQRSKTQGASDVPGVVCHASVPSDSCPGASVEENNTDQRSHGDKSLGEPEEEKHIPIPERESPLLVRAPPVDGQLEVQHSIDKGETIPSLNSDADHHEANEKLISAPSAGGNTSHFYDVAMRELDFEHLEEVQVPNTPVESFGKVRSIQNIHIPGFHELDHDASPNIKASFFPNSVSGGSSASEEAISPVDTPIMHEAETSSMEIIEVNSVEMNKIEHKMHSENSRDEIGIYEEKNSITDLTSHSSIAEHNDTSNRDTERDGQDYTEQKSSEEETLSKENKVQPASSFLDTDNKEHVSGLPEVNMQSIEVPEKTELTYVEAEIMSRHDQVDLDTARQMPELELGDKEIEKTLVLDPSQAEQVIGETITESSEQGILQVNKSVRDSTTDETSMLEVRSIDSATSNYNKVDDEIVATHRVLPDSAADIPNVTDSQETQGISELNDSENIPLRATSLPPMILLDGNTEKELKPYSDDGSVEVKAETVESSVGEESSVRKVSIVAAEKPEHEVRTQEDLHSSKSVEGEGKSSKTSSSSSSSSSESSSSD